MERKLEDNWRFAQPLRIERNLHLLDGFKEWLVSLSGNRALMMFQDDEIYLGNLEEKTTTFVRLEVFGKAPEAEIHISGIVEGSPIAAVPAKTIAMEEE